MFRHLHRLAGINMSNTTPYHPMGDGQVERMNRTLINMLKSLSETAKMNWKDHLPQLMFAYNSTLNHATGYSPFYLMFGRPSRLPIDSMFPNGDATKDSASYSDFVKKWKREMDQAYDIANQQIKKAGEYNKKMYDQKLIKSVEIIPGDKVLMKNVKERGGTGKLRSL